MGLGQQYCRQVRQHLTGLHANFPPNRPLALGDFGIRRDEVFQRMGNLAQLGVRFGVVEGTPQSSFQFKSEGAVEVEFVAKGEVRPGGVPAARAGIELRFNRQDAVFFNASGCTVIQIDDLIAVETALIALLNAGRWDTSFVVVTNLIRAAHTTAIASADRSSEIVLEASSEAVPEIDLGDVGLKLRTKRSRSTALEIVTASDQTPLMQLSRIRGLFSDRFRPEAAALPASGAETTRPFVFSTEIEPPILTDSSSDETSGIEPATRAEGAPGAGLADFALEARQSDFEVDRAMSAYIPLLEACYALAHAQPVAFPDGYQPIGEIRATLSEMAAATTDPPAVQEAVRNDMEAAEASVADPSAFGFVVREQATGAVLVCIRGTQTPREWLANFTAVPNAFSEVPGFGLVHLGFERMNRSVRASIQQALTGIPADTRVTVLGHSLGGAMATLATIDLKHNFGRTNIDLCTFGGPRVGKIMFRRNFDRAIAACYRVTNKFDIVPHVPSLVTGWVHVGEEIEVDGDVDNSHSLRAYLQGLRNLGAPRELSMAGPVMEAAAFAGVVSMRVP